MSIEKARIAARKALERMYQGRATVIEYQKVKDEWGMTNFQEVTVLAVTVKAPVRVPILQRCDCGATMHRIRSGKDILCPACREPLKKTDVVAVTMWD